MLFTAPGERVNRPTFGSGLLQLVFDPNRQEVATATQLLVQSSLQQWLGDLIQVEDATVEGGAEMLVVTIVYRLVRTQERRVEQFGEAAAHDDRALLPARASGASSCAASTLNGIDFLEVLASHRTLLVHCLRAGRRARRAQRRDRGRRARDRRRGRVGGARRQVRGRLRRGRAGARRPAAGQDRRARRPRVELGRLLDLRRCGSSARRRTPTSPRRASTRCSPSAAFSFKVDCPSEFDCATRGPIEEPEPPAPQIDYLAKDYASFRRLMLDRLAVLVPDWRERSAADTLMTLVELLAYSADSLSYFQDAAATEAYLGTARLRASVRRHARLVDYRDARRRERARLGRARGERRDGRRGAAARHDGADRRGRRRHEAGAADVGRGALAGRARVRDAARAPAATRRRNEIPLYAWGDGSCCLPAGATRATLIGQGRPTSRCTPATC